MRYLAFIGLALIGVSAWTPTPVVPQPVNSTIRDWRGKNWGLYNTRAYSHVNAPAAWAELRTAKKPVVAVIDTGIEKTHPALFGGVSNFGRAFGDPKSLVPDDVHGHGTHVSGIILSVSDFHALIVPVRYYSETNTGSQNLKNTVAAIYFAVDHGAKVINYSGGGPEFSEQEYLAIKYAETHNVLFVAAAGNEHQNTDLVENYYYPSAYRLSNIISVASTDIHNNLLASSNWGKTKVDVAAPGENIYSTLPGGRYGYMSGTSQATAFVSGIAAMILAQNPKLSARDVKKIILSSVDRVPQLADKVATGGRVNAYTAVRAAKVFTKEVE